MKRLYTLLTFTVAIALVMSSCSSSRNAQNTDDIYYSSGGNKVAARSGSNNSSANNDEYYSTAPSDNYIRMKAQDPERWSYFDDYSAYDSYYSPASSFALSAGYGYGYPSYGFGYGMGFGAPFGPAYGFGFWDPYFAWNSYFMWNSWYNPYFYNPYYGGCVIAGHGVAATGVYSHLRPFNSVAYSNGLVRTTNNGSGFSSGSGNRFYRPGMTTTSAYNSGLNGQGTRPVNNTYNRTGNNNTYYRPSNNNNNTYRPVYQPSSQPVRTYTPSPSMGGGGGGGFSRPGRH